MRAKYIVLIILIIAFIVNALASFIVKEPADD